MIEFKPKEKEETMMKRGQIPGRCGSCTHFPGNAKKCTHENIVVRGHIRYERAKVYANDYGKDYCKSYEKL